jgi:hypothetical protein
MKLNLLFLICWIFFIAGAAVPAQEFKVTQAVLKADVNYVSGKCPVTVAFTGTITVNAPGIVKYTFLRSDGADAPIHTLDFKQAETQTVTTSWTLGGKALPEFKGWKRLKILSPNAFETSTETGAFSIACGGDSSGYDGQISAAQKPVEIVCPTASAKIEITTPLVKPWWQTPRINALSNVSLMEIGGQPSIVCEYGGFSLMRRVPEGASNCKMNSQRNGFSCW